MESSLAPPQHNMVSSSGIRSSIQKARATDMVRDQVLKNLRAAEGGSTVDANTCPYYATPVATFKIIHR